MNFHFADLFRYSLDEKLQDAIKETPQRNILPIPGQYDVEFGVSDFIRTIPIYP